MPVPLPACQISHKSGAGGSFVKPQAAHPFIRNLRVTQLGQPPQKLLAGFAQVAPTRVRVENGKTLGERAAAAKSDA